MSADILRQAADRLDARVRDDSSTHDAEWGALAAWLREVQEYHRLGVHALGDGALTLARAILAAPPLTAQVTRPPSVT